MLDLDEASCPGFSKNSATSKLHRPRRC